MDTQTGGTEWFEKSRMETRLETCLNMRNMGDAQKDLTVIRRESYGVVNEIRFSVPKDSADVSADFSSCSYDKNQAVFRGQCRRSALVDEGPKSDSLFCVGDVP